jgi:adenylate cyclase
MTEQNRPQFEKFIRGISVRQVRLACGLVLFTYLVSHFLNHALGNISLDALAAGLHYHILFWRFLPVAIVFYTAALVHAGLGIWALYQRRQFSWRAIEPLQLLLGLSIPTLVISHVTGIRLGHALFGIEKLYPQVFYADWVAAPFRMWMLFALLIIAWIHGCIGLYFWLRIKASFKRTAPFLLAAAVLVPTLALLGLYQGGRNIVQEGASAAWRTENLSQRNVGTPAQQQMLERFVDYFLIGYFGLIGLAVAARGARALHERRGGMITLSYGNGRTIRVPKGLSVLEASLRHRVPHASVCGGRARCSTCRIRVIGDCASLPTPSEREAFVLDRVGTDADPAIRLACQLRPEADLSFFQLFMPHTMPASAHASQPHRIGQERYLVSMFVDMRSSTQLAENRLPFDTVFIVNRFLGAVSQAVIECGGQPNQFLGDGQLALFGLGTSRQTACRQALKAAAAIDANVAELNQFLKHDLSEPIRFGIGIHAARLQDMTKSVGCEAIVSEEVRRTAGLPANALPQQQVEIRGRTDPMIVRIVASTKMLLPLTDAAAA